MKMIDMDIYFKDRGFTVDRQYECVNNESLYHFTIRKDDTTLRRTFRYPASDNNAYKSKLQKEFLEETIKAFDELYSKAEPNFQFMWPKVNPWLSDIISLSEQRLKPRIKNVIFNDPATIVFWSDGTKTVVKCQDGDEFDAEKGLALAISKKALGNKGNYCNELKKWLPEKTYPWMNPDLMTSLKYEPLDPIPENLKEKIYAGIKIPDLSKLSSGLNNFCANLKRARKRSHVQTALNLLIEAKENAQIPNVDKLICYLEEALED